MHTSIIVAASENNVIGRGNELPWHIPDDLRRFKNLTMGKPVIMGRKTYESIVARLGKPLPGRTNIVISKSGYDARGGAVVCADLAAALKEAHMDAQQKSLDEVFVIGGAQIYELAKPLADRLYLTRVHTDIEGDAYFTLPSGDWRETAAERHEGQPGYTFLTLERAA